MLADWTSYRPEDFLLFGPEVYWRLFALQNAAFWPLQAAVLAFGIVLLAGLVRPRLWMPRVDLIGLALLWLFVAWTFLRARYAPVNWAIDHAVPVFALQAMALLLLALKPARVAIPAGWTPARCAGVALLVHALAVHPLLALAAGRPLREAEVLGLAPDPTAIGTLGVVVAAIHGWRGALCLTIPIVWCLVSAATLLTLGGWDGWVPLTAAILALAAFTWSAARRE